MTAIARPERSGRGSAPLLLFVAAGAIFLLNLIRFRAYLLDDAYITLRYARHLADGQGLIFNLGERVEGYTNFLWVLLSAAFMALKVEPMAALKCVSLVVTLGLLGVVVRLDGAARQASSFPTALLWLLPVEALGYWATTGMETALFTFLFVAAVGLGWRESRRGRGRLSVGPFVLLALTRPDGIGLFLLCQAVFVVLAPPAERSAAVRRSALNGLWFVLLYGPYFAWRWHWYGALLPNTFSAKVTGGAAQLQNGAASFVEWARAMPVFALALLTPLLLLSPRLRPALARRPEIIAFSLIALGHAAYVIAVGGDFMAFHRFYLPIIPLCALILGGLPGALAPELPSGLARRLPAVAVGLLILNSGAAALSGQGERAFIAHRTTLAGEAVGRYFAARLQPHELMAVNTIGSEPYWSRLPTIDMLGLTDAHVARSPQHILSRGWGAHSRGDGDYVLSRRPRAIIWYNGAGLGKPYYLSDRQLADSLPFRFFYQRRQVTLPAAEPERPLARFPGAPLGQSGEVSPDLGIRLEVSAGPLPITTVYPVPIQTTFFERREAAEDGLWALADRCSADAACFVGAVAGVWQAEQAARAAASPDSARTGAARAEVEALCAEALQRIRAGDRDHARQLLSRAAELNHDAGSPLVYQYVANLAVQDKDLFLAVQAQREALRLAPGDATYRQNLERLLATPYRKFTE